MKNTNIVLTLRALMYAFMASIIVSGCMTNPVTGKRELGLISENDEVKIGRENYMIGQQSQGGAYITDPELVAYVRGVGDKLASVSERSHLPYEFVILNNSVPNAWAMPGGKIAINRGLLLEMSTEGELAAVMSHEIVHAAARHGAKGMERGMLLQGALIGVAIAADDHEDGEWALLGSQIAGSLLNLKYSRGQESESDYYGMLYMSRAGYDPAEAVRLQETFVRLKNGKKAGAFDRLFGSHPPSEDRVKKNKETASQLPAGGFVGREEYQAKIARLKRTKPAYDNYDKGLQALSKRNHSEALKLAESAITIEPREALFYGLKGDALKAMGKHRQAEEAYNYAIELNPEFYHFRKQRGHLRRARGDLAGAKEDFQSSLALLPTDDVHLTMGKMALNNNDRQTALAHFNAAAGTGTEYGQQAAGYAARMTMASNPDSFIQTQVSLNSRGYVVLKVKNASPIPAKNVAGQLYVFDKNGSRVGEPVDYHVRGTMASGSITTITTRIGPVTSNSIIGDVRATVTAAHPAD